MPIDEAYLRFCMQELPNTKILRSRAEMLDQCIELLPAADLEH
jgi:hypothetical protein